MTAFDQAWSLIKMPAKGWECPACKMPMMVEDTSGLTLRCMNCGATAMQPVRRGREIEGLDNYNAILDDEKEEMNQRRIGLGDELRQQGNTIVDKPKNLTEYQPHRQFDALELALNDLGFTSVQQLLQEYVRLKAATMNQDIRGMGLTDEADEMDEKWIEGVLGRNKQFDSPFMRTNRGEAWQ